MVDTSVLGLLAGAGVELELWLQPTSRRVVAMPSSGTIRRRCGLIKVRSS
jgi:hypothetical protein